MHRVGEIEVRLDDIEEWLQGHRSRTITLNYRDGRWLLSLFGDGAEGEPQIQVEEEPLAAGLAVLLKEGLRHVNF